MLANFATGLAAAWVLASGHLVLAAVLLQAKTVLDNADGQLARMTGRTSVLGRYLDSECDLVSNAAMCAALGYLTHWWVGALALACLTFVLSVNYNAERLYRREHGEPAEAMPHAPGRARLLERYYALVYAPRTGSSSATSRGGCAAPLPRSASPGTTARPSRSSPTSA